MGKDAGNPGAAAGMAEEGTGKGGVAKTLKLYQELVCVGSDLGVWVKM